MDGIGLLEAIRQAGGHPRPPSPFRRGMNLAPPVQVERAHGDGARQPVLCRRQARFVPASVGGGAFAFRSAGQGRTFGSRWS